MSQNKLQQSITTWWRQQDLRSQSLSAFKTGLAAVLCLWLGHTFGLAHSYWAAITAIVVMGSDTGVTFTSCRDRLIGTAIGAFLGWATFYAWHGHYLLYGVAVALCIFICSLLEFDKAGRLAAVALTIIVLIHIDAGPGQAALARFLEVALGIVIALAVTLLVFPAKKDPIRQSQRLTPLLKAPGCEDKILSTEEYASYLRHPNRRDQPRPLQDTWPPSVFSITNEL